MFLGDGPVDSYDARREEIEGLVEKMGFRETVELGGRVKEYLSAREMDLSPETRAWLKRLKASWDEVL